jgi:hypothetical protein
MSDVGSDLRSLIYGEYYDGAPIRSTNGGDTFSAASIGSGLSPGGGLNAPMIMDPNDRNTLLMGDTSLWRTTSASVDTPTWTSSPESDHPKSYYCNRGRAQ